MKLKKYFQTEAVKIKTFVKAGQRFTEIELL